MYGARLCLRVSKPRTTRDFGVYLCWPISASRFHERIAWASDAERDRGRRLHHGL